MELKNNRLCIVRSLLDYMSNLMNKLCKTYEISCRKMFENIFENIIGNIAKTGRMSISGLTEPVIYPVF